jgi:hypothetical protein
MDTSGGIMANSFRNFLISGFLFALLLAGLTSCSCGGDDDDDSGESDDAGDDDGDDAADDDTAGCGSVDLLPGTWTAGQITMEISDDLSYHTVGASQATYDVYGMIEVDGCTARFTETSGQGACPSAQVGEYGFVVTETALTTTLVSDACAGRVVGLDGTVFERKS